MNEDLDVLLFALKWRHWGGGPAEDIFVEFGLAPHEYFRKLDKIVSQGAPPIVTKGIARQLTQICRDRLGDEIVESNQRIKPLKNAKRAPRHQKSAVNFQVESE